MRKLEGWKAVVSVPSQRKAWEVYPLEVYYPDDPTRLCRPKAGQSLSKHLKGRMVPRVSPSVRHVFWIKRILLFSLFLDTFSCSKEFAVSLFPDTFSVQRILLFPCFQTLSIFKGFWRFPVSRHFNFSKVSGNRKNNQILWENHYCQGILSFLLFIDTFWIQKCQVTEKQPNPLKRS